MNRDTKILKRCIYTVFTFLVNLFTFYLYLHLNGGTLFDWGGGLWNYIRMSFIWGSVFYSAYGFFGKGELFWGLFMLSLMPLISLGIGNYRIFAFIMIVIFAFLGAMVYWVIYILKLLLGLLHFPNSVITVFHYGMILISGFVAAAILVHFEDTIGKKFAKK